MIRTKKEFEKFFRQEVLPFIRAEENKYRPGVDRPMRREEWNNTIDAMVQDGELPERACDWVSPW